MNGNQATLIRVGGLNFDQVHLRYHYVHPMNSLFNLGLSSLVADPGIIISERLCKKQSCWSVWIDSHLTTLVHVGGLELGNLLSTYSLSSR